MYLMGPRTFIMILLVVLTTTSGCMFQVGIENLDESLNNGVVPQPSNVGSQAPVGIIDAYPEDGINVNFYSFVTAYVPTQQVFGAHSADKWYWVKSIISYFDLSKFFVTEDGYQVLISSEDNLVEGVIFE